MKNFSLITTHYLVRFLRDIKELILLLTIPIGLMVIYSFIPSQELVAGYNTQATLTMPVMMIGFQFFSGGTLIGFLYPDIKESMSWRLRSTPQSLFSFVLPGFFANWLFTILTSVVVAVFGVVVLNAYVGSLLVLSMVILLSSAIATLVYILVFLFVPKLSTANALIYVIGFGHFILSGFMFVPLGDSAFARFMMSYGTPIGLGTRAINYTGAFRGFTMGSPLRAGQAWSNIMILAGVAMVLTVITFVVGGKKKI